mgnify:CR=1 FL=1
MEELTFKDVFNQSTSVFKQFGESKWKPFARENANHPLRRDPRELQGCGVGKVLVSVGMGASTEEHVEVLKKYRDRIDVIVCDKGFKPLLEHGVKADYVMLCDCNIIFQKWAPKEEDTVGVKLISTSYANIDWTRKWRGPIYFYLNRDAICSEKIFAEIMGPATRTIPASSNVGNAQVVFMVGIDEHNPYYFAGYERILLIGYDYSWRVDGNYYAWANPAPKRYYMASRNMLDISSHLVLTSENLVFSARWLSQYVSRCNLPVVNCSGRGVLPGPSGNFEEQLQLINPSITSLIKSAQSVYARAKQAELEAFSNLKRTKEELFHGCR